MRLAVRQLARSPLYTATMVCTLAIGIAAAAAIFSVVRGVVLRPLPFADEQRLVSVQEYQPSNHRDQTTVASANLPRLKALGAFSGVTAFNYSEFVVSDDRDAERLLGARVDGDLLAVLGIRPAIGRGISTDDIGDTPAHVVVVSDALWKRRLRGAPAALGRSITIDGAAYTVIGVMARVAEFPRNPSMSRDVDIWVPRRAGAQSMMRRAMRDLTVVARAKPNVTLAEAQGELDASAERGAKDDAALNAGWRARIVPLRDTMIGAVRPALSLLAGCVAILVLIATANASAASLARAAVRRQQHAIRLALGASQARVAESVLAEAVVLGTVATAIALPVSGVLRRLLVDAAPVAIPRQTGIAIDGWTILFALVVAGGSAIVTALAPLTLLRTLDVNAVLTDASRTFTGSRTRSRFLNVFNAAQLALGTILLATTARLYDMSSTLNRVDPGFRAEGVTTATLALGGMRYQDQRARAALSTQLLQVVRTIPGVERAAITSLLPMSGGLMSSTFEIPGDAVDSSHSAALRAVSPDFFATLGIPIHRGRAIMQGDDEGAPPVMVVNEAFEREVFNGRPALGRLVRVSPPGADSARTFEIVGVAGDAKEKDLLAPATPIIYFSDHQASFPHAVLMVRSRAQFPGAAVRSAVHDLDPSLALDDVGDLESKVRSAYALQFFILAVLATFAVSGALLIAVGVYGSVSFTVAAQQASIGVRMALGASPMRILISVLEQTALVAIGGCSVGIFAVIALQRLSISQAILGQTSLWGATAIAALGICVLALMASLVPARRASGVDPVSLLRE